MAVTTAETTPTYRIKVVATGGLAQNGKSTLCHLLQSHAALDGWHCQRFSFADPLKSIVRIVQQDYINKNPDALQSTSELWKCDYGKGCFAKDLVARIDAYTQTLPTFFDKVLILVDDLRFLNEVAALQSWTAVGRELFLVRVVRPGFEEFDRDMAHESETELLDVPYDNFRVEAADMDNLVQDAASLWTLIKT